MLKVDLMLLAPFRKQAPAILKVLLHRSTGANLWYNFFSIRSFYEFIRVISPKLKKW